MDLSFDPDLVERYRGPTQKIRNITEGWFSNHVYCPSCGHPQVTRFANNRPVADFFCPHCREEYELKSQARPIGDSVPDGAYRTMIERLRSSTNPNLFLLRYDSRDLAVRDLLVIPKYFFVPEVIGKRRPLSLTARRAGWVGCNILLKRIPSSGRIFLIKDGTPEQRIDVLAQWRKTAFVGERQGTGAQGWLVSVMSCVERLGKTTFSLAEVYAFEPEFARMFATNNHVREKIRQQLQVLRDRGYLEFLGRGLYRVNDGASNRCSRGGK